MDKDNPFVVKRLAANNEYYTNVFKKTERTVSVVFYILSHIAKTEYNSFHIDQISARALSVHEASLATLGFFEFEATTKMFPFQQSLVALEGTLRIANAARVMTDETLALLLSEVDLVQRYLRHHFVGALPSSVGDYSAPSTMSHNKSELARLPRTASPVQRPRRSAIPQGDISSDAHLVYSQLVDRSARIKTVLEAKPEATIKDIAEVITDVSEKTIQRELNSLIEKGQVIRQGERRWSKYSIAK